MTNTTATVETITAEVRTLMIGSRQVTASVYAQLDEASPDQIVPFGRVTPKIAEPGYVYIVGKHTETGELVRASTPYGATRIANAVRATSKVVAWEDSAHFSSEKAHKAESDAAAREKSAAEKLDADNSWCNSVASHLRDAAKAEARAAEAETELARLKALHEAAGARYYAQKCREEAEELQAEAARLREECERHRADVAKASAQVEAWKERDARLTEQLTDLANEWSTLPLVVLAGLR